VRAIVGIGNPGSLYKANRHNVGFQFLDFFAEQRSLAFKASKFDYYYSEDQLSGMPFVLIKPDTYVNLSGVAVLNCITNYKINVQDVLIVVDDINLATALIRIRKSGGDGGHNGLNSIIYHLNSNVFPRLRIGIGNDFKTGDLSNYVLSDFDKKELLKLNKSFDLSIQLIESFISNGFHKMINTYSRLVREENLNNKSD
jgi:peptidyl-tRNA hydrolase, PTH1 family